MTFKEKIDKILEVNKLNIDSVTALEDAVGASRSSINNFYNENKEPGRKTLKRIKSLHGLNWGWWETSAGPVFTAGSEEKLTGVQNGSDTTEIPAGVNLDEESKKLLRIAGKSVQYAFVPKTILEGEYRIELKSAIDEQTALRRDAIQGYKKLVKKLEDEIADLRSGKIPISITTSQDAK